MFSEVTFRRVLYGQVPEGVYLIVPPCSFVSPALS